MNKAQLTKLRQDLYSISQLFQSLETKRDPKEKKNISEELKKKLAEIKPKLPPSNDTSYSAIQLHKDFTELSENFETFLEEMEAEEKEAAELFEGFKEESVDFEEEKKKVELHHIMEATKLTSELVRTQEMINEQLKKDSDNLEAAIVDTEGAISRSQATVENLAGASREERKKRGMYFTTGGTVLGAVVGKGIGGAIGMFFSAGLSKIVGKRHEKQLNKVINMNKE